ncbi:MAG: T9SS type A sorting domain-containing protein [Ignavibacteriota bacterium]
MKNWPRFLFIAVSIIFFPALIQAQISPKIEWQRCYGGARMEGFNPPRDHMLIRTSDSGYAFVAQTGSDDVFVSGNHKDRLNHVEDDYWLVKLDKYGGIEWQKCFGGGGTETPMCLIQASDGGFVICGETVSHDGDITQNPDRDTLSGYPRGWVVKTDFAGRLDWETCVGPVTGWLALFSIIESPDSGFIAVGGCFSNEEGWLSHTAGQDALMIKLNSKGILEWRHLYGGSYGAGANSVVRANGGGYIFAGSTLSNDGDVSGNHSPYKRYVTVTSDVWIVKVNDGGIIDWQKCYGGPATEGGEAIIRGPKGGYIIAGTATSDGVDVSGTHGGSDGWIITINDTGKLLSQRCIGGSKFDKINSIIVTQRGNIAFGAYTGSNDGDLSELHQAVRDSGDGWIGELSPDGKLLWQKCVGGTGDDGIYSIIQTDDNGFLIYGRTWSNNGDVSGNHGMSDIWVAKLSDITNGVTKGSSTSAFMNPYPNPSVSEVNLELYRSSPIEQIGFYNLLGTQVFPNYRIEGTVAVIDVHTLLKGTYFIKATFRNTEKALVRKFMVTN